MKVLITGATGFIGSYLTKSIINNPKYTEICTTGRKEWNNKLWSTRCHHKIIDLGNQWEVERLFSEFKPDVIFHLAGNPLPKLDEQNPTRIWQDNVVATHNLLHFCPEGCNFVYASSVVVYGDMPGIHYECDELRPTSIYGLTKLAGEEAVRIYDANGKINGKIARLSATIGKGSSHGIIIDLINKIKLENPYLEVIGDCPGSSKSYVYIDDTIDALIKISNTNKYETYNISSDGIASCKDIAEIIINNFDKNKYIKWLGNNANWVGDNKILEISNDKLKYLNWKSKSAIKAVELAVKSYYE